MGGIPKTKKKEEILAEMKKVTDGVVEVIVYPSAADKSKNRGFAFVEYESHRAAAMARRKLLPGKNSLNAIERDKLFYQHALRKKDYLRVHCIVVGYVFPKRFHLELFLSGRPLHI